MSKTSIIHEIPDDKFKNIVDTSNTYSEMLKIIGLPTAGNNYGTLKKRIKSMGIPFSSKYKGKFNREITPLSEILVKGSTFHRGHMKERLIKEGILETVCAICGMEATWEGKPLTLILDHINGIPNDNELSNLRLVCPNCNSQLPTHAGRKNKKSSNKCIDCGKNIQRRSDRCKSCALKQRNKKGIGEDGNTQDFDSCIP